MSSRRNQQRRRLAGRRATRAHTYVKAAEKFAALVVIRTGGRHRRRDIGRSAAELVRAVLGLGHSCLQAAAAR